MNRNSNLAKILISILADSDRKLCCSVSIIILSQHYLLLLVFSLSWCLA